MGHSKLISSSSSAATAAAAAFMLAGFSRILSALPSIHTA